MFKRIAAILLLSCAVIAANDIVIRKLDAEMVPVDAFSMPKTNAVRTLEEDSSAIAFIRFFAEPDSSEIKFALYDDFALQNTRIPVNGAEGETTHPFTDAFNHNLDKFGGSGVRAFAFHPELPFGVVAGRSAGELFVLSWDVKDGKIELIDLKSTLESLRIEDSHFACPMFSPDGKWLIVAIGVSKSPRFIAFPAGSDYPGFVNVKEVVSLGTVSDIKAIAWSLEPSLFIVVSNLELFRWKMDDAEDAGIIIALPTGAAAAVNHRTESANTIQSQVENKMKSLFSKELSIDDAIDFLLAQVIDSLVDYEEAIEIAYELFEVEEYKGAKTLFYKALEFNPPPPHAAAAHNGLGLAYMMMGNTAKALENYDIGTKSDPKNAYIYNNRAMLLAYCKGDFKKALKEVNIALKLEKNSDAIYDTRAQIYLFKGKHKSALSDFKKLKTMGKHDLEFYLDEGLNFFTIMILNDSANADIYAYRGVLQILLREFDKAQADFNNALKLNPKHPIVRRYQKYVTQKMDIIDIHDSGK